MYFRFFVSIFRCLEHSNNTSSNNNNPRNNIHSNWNKEYEELSRDPWFDHHHNRHRRVIIIVMAYYHSQEDYYYPSEQNNAEYFSYDHIYDNGSYNNYDNSYSNYDSSNTYNNSSNTYNTSSYNNSYISSNNNNNSNNNKRRRLNRSIDREEVLLEVSDKMPTRPGQSTNVSYLISSHRVVSLRTFFITSHLNS